MDSSTLTIDKAEESTKYVMFFTYVKFLWKLISQKIETQTSNIENIDFIIEVIECIIELQILHIT